MNNQYHRKPANDPEIVKVSKKRPCLMCQSHFQSTWAGERICQPCKQRSAWRDGGDWASGGRAA